MLQVENLGKSYGAFAVRGLTFRLPAGYILGFIGQNGAGKSTTIKCLVGVNPYDEGSVTFFGKELKDNARDILQDVGFSSGAMDCYPNETVKKLGKVYGTFFKNHDGEKFARLCRNFHIDENKKVRELSQGMKVKLGLALALAHDAKLLILDEPTSGLDPVARAEVIDILRLFIEDGTRSVLFSTHITSDLEKCADYILFIDGGKQLLFDTKDEVLASHLLISGKKSDLTDVVKSKLIGRRTTPFGFTALIKREDADCLPSDIVTETPTLEDVMVYYTKEEIVL